MITKKDPGFGRGLFYGFGAYLIWGSFPLLIAMLSFASPWEIVIWRIVFGFFAAAVITTLTRSWTTIKVAFSDRKFMLLQTIAALLIFVNWQLMVIAVASHRAVESSLGYFINPLVTIILAVIFLGEKLNRAQWVASIFGAVAVLVLAFEYGSLPWLAIALAVSFGFYGLLKKKMGNKVSSVDAFAIEAGMLLPVAALQIFLLPAIGIPLVFGNTTPLQAFELAAFGIVTAVPLIMFGASTRLLPLKYVGFIQYLTPILQFITAITILGEPMPPARLAGFVLVWVGLAVLIVDAIWAGRQQKTK